MRVLTITLALSSGIASSMALAEATRIHPGQAPNAAAAVQALADKEAKDAFLATSDSARLAQGDSFDLPVSVDRNRCVVVVAASQGGIKELDIKLVGDMPGLPPTVLMQDETTGPTATLGGASDKRTCKSFPKPWEARVRAVASAGSGAVVVSVFTRHK